jgi:translation initiation factor IF-1
LSAGVAEVRRTERGWEMAGQVITTDDDPRPTVAMIASLAGRRIKTWSREGDVVIVETERKRPCRRRR